MERKRREREGRWEMKKRGRGKGGREGGNYRDYLRMRKETVIWHCTVSTRQCFHLSDVLFFIS